MADEKKKKKGWPTAAKVAVGVGVVGALGYAAYKLWPRAPKGGPQPGQGKGGDGLTGQTQNKDAETARAVAEGEKLAGKVVDLLGGIFGGSGKSAGGTGGTGGTLGANEAPADAG